MRKKMLTVIGLLFAFVNGAVAQSPVYSAKEFKPLHGLHGVWKLDSQRGAIYEE